MTIGLISAYPTLFSTPRTQDCLWVDVPPIPTLFFVFIVDLKVRLYDFLEIQAPMEWEKLKTCSFCTGKLYDFCPGGRDIRMDFWSVVKTLHPKTQEDTVSPKYLRLSQAISDTNGETLRTFQAQPVTNGCNIQWNVNMTESRRSQKVFRCSSHIKRYQNWSNLLQPDRFLPLIRPFPCCAWFASKIGFLQNRVSCRFSGLNNRPQEPPG